MYPIHTLIKQLKFPLLVAPALLITLGTFFGLFRTSTPHAERTVSDPLNATVFVPPDTQTSVPNRRDASASWARIFRMSAKAETGGDPTVSGSISVVSPSPISQESQSAPPVLIGDPAAMPDPSDNPTQNASEDSGTNPSPGAPGNTDDSGGDDGDDDDDGDDEEDDDRDEDEDDD